MKLMVTVQFSK